MSKITNDGLTRSGTGGFKYSCTHMTTVGVKGLTVHSTVCSATPTEEIQCVVGGHSVFPPSSIPAFSDGWKRA